MMKRLVAFFLILCLLAPAGSLFSSAATTYTSGNYEYALSSGKATITGLVSSLSGAVSIPSTLNGYSVVAIADASSSADGVFYRCTSITSITLPSTLTKIGDYSFSWCTGMTSVSIPSSVVQIGKNAFTYCRSLSSITLPNSVTTLGSGAFYNCSSLSSVTIGSGIKTIGVDTFNSCTVLTSINVPSSVTSIGGYAFANCRSLKNIRIPASVSSIDSTAFQNCNSVVIICDSGSYAESYARSNGISYETGTSTTSVTGVTVSPKDVSLSIGATIKLTETVLPSNATNKAVTWTSSNTNVAVVDGTGVVFAKATGNTTITVKTLDGNKSATCSISVYDEKEVFVNVHSYYYDCHNIWYDNGFNQNTDEGVLKKNATASRVWDSIKDLGEVASFKFDKLQITADYYDAYLADLLLAFSETTAADEVKIKAFDYYTKGFSNISKFLKSSKEYNDVFDIANNFVIESAFSKDYELSASLKEGFSKVFKDAYTYHPDLFRDIYQGFDCANEICDDINKAVDAYNAFRDCYNAYCISRATKEVCSEFFDFCYDAANELSKSNPQFAGWFRKNIDKFKNNAKTDGEYYAATIAAWKTGYLAYDVFVKNMVRDVAYNVVAHALGDIAVGEVFAVVAAWNVGTALGDLIAPNDTESAYYMYYVSPVEGAMQTVVNRYGATMKNTRSIDDAYKFDVGFTTLKYTNIALYNKAFDFASKHRVLWFKTKTMKDNMENATYYKEKWQMFKCHNADVSSTTNTNYNAVGVRCPVDIYLYNTQNQLVLSIVNEKVKAFNDPNIAVNIRNEQKAICYPAIGNYRIEIISRSNGTMDYSILAVGSDSIREIETNGISLSSNQKYTGSIPQSQNAGASQYALTTNGATIPEDFDSFNSSPDVRPTGWVSNETIMLRKGETKTLSYYISCDKDAAFWYTYEDDGSSKLTFNKATMSITITANSLGRKVYYLGARFGTTEHYKLCSFTVDVVKPGIAIQEKDFRLECKDQKTLHAISYDNLLREQSVTWSSSNSSVARVDSNGTVYAIKKGVATITATAADGKIATCTVSVYYTWWQWLIIIFLLGFIWY